MKSGHAIVAFDETTTNVVSGRPGAQMSVIWTTQGFPVNNDGNDDASRRQTGTTLDNGTVFRVVSFGPGVTPRNHRTDSIDYAVVMSGEIDMELDDGVTVRLKAGDVLVQRGTIHNWVNKGTDAVRDRLHPDFRQAGHRRRQGARARTAERSAHRPQDERTIRRH